jgi:hypothetical protein
MGRLARVLRRCSVSAAVASLIASGCMHAQLRQDTVQTALSSGDIQQQQVLDNLAMFATDPNAFPSFSVPNQGSANVTDVGSASATPALARLGLTGQTVAPFVFSGLGLSVTGSRTQLDGFTLTPINDPRKLELMRCAFQRAVSSCGCGPESETCPDCKSIFNKFYTGDINGDIRAKANGVVTSECLNAHGCGFHVCCKKCVPKHCALVGRYCDTYVWVGPDGRDELSKLTLMILDYATNNPPVPITKQVQYYIDEYGVPTNRNEAVGIVTANINHDEIPASLLNLPQADELRIEQEIKSRLRDIESAMSQYECIASFGDEKSTTAGAAGLGKRENKKDDTSSDGSGTQDAAPPQGAKVGKADSTRKAPCPDLEKYEIERYKQLLKERQSLSNKLEYLREQLRTPGLKNPYSPAAPTPLQITPFLGFNLANTTLTNGR